MAFQPVYSYAGLEPATWALRRLRSNPAELIRLKRKRTIERTRSIVRSGGEKGIRTLARRLTGYRISSADPSTSWVPLRIHIRWCYNLYCNFILIPNDKAVRILLENASFRQVLKPVRTSKLTFPRVIWRHPAKHPLGFRVVLVTTASIHLHDKLYIV